MATRRTLLLGGLLAVFAGLLVDHGAHFGAQVTGTALLGLALGSVLGLVTTVSPVARCIGFVSGFGLAWMGFVLRAGFLPDIPAGRAIATTVVVVAITVIAALSRGKIPLATGLLGAGAMAGAYETSFDLNPAAFTTESVAAATTVLLCAALGFLVAELLSEALPTPSAGSPRRHRQIPPESIGVPTQRVASADEATTSADSSTGAKA